MQWSGDDNAGFTRGDVWLPVGMDYRAVNVAAQEKDRYSLLNFYRNLIAIRKKNRALLFGDSEAAIEGHHRRAFLSQGIRG